VGAEQVIHGSDLRHRWTVVVGMIANRGGTTALSDLPAAYGLARVAGLELHVEECGDPGASA
jgi:hypothetical protein